MRGEPPRHIRDIAHLYLSRMHGPGSGAARVIVAGIGAEVVPAFHVASLALAAASRGIPVRIVEASGLPVNAGCFLGLDPRCWVPGVGRASAAVAAFPRVTFTLTDEPDAAVARDPAAEGAIDIVHAPPWSSGVEHTRALERALARAGPATVLYLAERDEEPRPWRQTNGRADVARCVAFVTRAGHAAAGDGCAGVFTHWMRALTDPLPVAMRDPGSRLARQYEEAISHLLAAHSRPASSQPQGHRDSRHVVIPFEPR
jgi:hypothetical protein